MKRFAFLFAALSGAVLLWAAWPVSPLTFLVFIAWLPLLWVEDHIQRVGKFFAAAYLHMLTWNLAVTWWVWNASLAGALSAFLANSLVMCVPWLLFYVIKRNLGRRVGYISLVAFWISFEFIHHNWELSWPWLTLGNAFATHPEWVQWYSFTGSTGGTLWILVSNIIAYSLFVEYRNNGKTKIYYRKLFSFVALLTIPILLSRFVLLPSQPGDNGNETNAEKNVVVVQPNIDPYNEKFTGSVEEQIQKLITLSEKQMDRNTSLVVWPETAVPVSANEADIKSNIFYNPVWSFLTRHPFVSLLTGINSYKVYGKDKKLASETARFDEQSGIYYDEFNTAAFFQADSTVQFYHKAKLVPGVETLPSFLGFMGKWFEDLGGISGTLGRDRQRKIFTAWDHHFKAAPIICYESIYSDYITAYVRNGANILTVITNDGWWGNTPGYRQHMNYARLRAIETRRWIARSANTGISCFIDPRGNIINPQPWDTASSIKLPVPVREEQTFFVRYGDLLSRIMAGAAAVLLVINLIYWIKSKWNQ